MTQFDFPTPQQTWNITHTMGNTVHVECWVDVQGTITKIVPNNIVINYNTIQITFKSFYSGYVKISAIKQCQI